MQDTPDPILVVPTDTLTTKLAGWLEALDTAPVLVSVDRLPNGDWAFQALPEVDPTLVARVRRILAQHEDVLRRLT